MAYARTVSVRNSTYALIGILCKFSEFFNLYFLLLLLSLYKISKNIFYRERVLRTKIRGSGLHKNLQRSAMRQRAALQICLLFPCVFWLRVAQSVELFGQILTLFVSLK